MFTKLKLFLFLIIAFPLVYVAQSRQTASVDIKIKLVKSMSISVHKNQNDNYLGNKNTSENFINPQLEKGDRNILVNYYNLSNQNNIIENISISPQLIIKSENSNNFVKLDLDSKEELSNLRSNEKLLFEIADAKKKYLTSENLAITIVY